MKRIHLRKVEPFDSNKVKTVLDFVHEIGKTPFFGSDIGYALEVMKRMFVEKDCFNVLTLSGAMTAGKMSYVIIEMVRRGWVQVVVSTGALMAHGLVEGQRMHHYLAPKGVSDAELMKMELNRIWKVVEPEDNFRAMAELLFKEIFPSFSGMAAVAPSEITWLIGKRLSEKFPKHPSILGECFKRNVPIFIPAWTDSDLALEKMAYDMMGGKNGALPFIVCEERDLMRFTDLIGTTRKPLGIFTIGGGVPRNWAQQVCPALRIIKDRAKNSKKIKKWRETMYSYGVRITTATPQDAGLSGCTYEEGKSWGKFKPDAMTAELYPCDATFFFPFLVTALCQYGDSLEVRRSKNKKGESE